MSDQNPLIDRYMSQFEAALQRYDMPERGEIAADLRSHIAEALQYGKPLDQVLEALGPAETLARAYAVELKINPRAERGSGIARAFAVLSILAASGLVSFIVVSVLATIAIGFVGSGLVLVVICAIEAMGVHLPGVQLAGLHPLLAMLVGFVIIAIGWAAGWALWAYTRALVRMLRRTLPQAWSPSHAA